VHHVLTLTRRRIVSALLAATCTTWAGGRAKGELQPSPTHVLHARPNGYEGVLPGPALDVRRGEEVSVRLVNELSEPTALHWHGVRLVNAMDGAPPLTQTAVGPGESFDYRFVAPDAGTFWYHPPRSAYRGLYGLLIVREAAPPDVDHDVALVFDARRHTEDATAFDYTINGATSFDIHAQPNQRLRLRLVNASPDAFVALHAERLKVDVRAIDGQPAQPFTARAGRLLLGPGNRADIFVDCTLPAGQTAAISIEGPGAPTPLGRIVCDDGDAARSSPRGEQPELPANGLPERIELRGAVRFDGAIDRVAARNDRPLFTAKRGRTVVVGISNPTPASRSIHLHGHSFRVLDELDDGWTPYWLDTLPLAPQKTAHIAFIADNPGKWLLEGLDRRTETEAWFEVS
jgi:FtsP/CotA-like multicopper oxidase with cupredoxin domain